MLLSKLNYSWLLSTILILTIGYHIGLTTGLRVRLNPEEEPDSEAIYNNLRVIFNGRNLFALRSAGLLKDEDIPPYMKDDVRNASGSYPKNSFIFRSNQMVRKGLSLLWFVPYEERVAIHVYDNPKDRDLAAGPQVNQELCGLELDYMLHMIKKHYQSFENATNYSIFSIMDTFGAPASGIMKGKTVFVGDYKGCLDEQLSVLRSELIKVNKTATTRYFKVNNQENDRLSKLKKVIYTILGYIKPFLGFAKTRESISLDKYKDKLKMVSMKYCLARLRWPSWPNNTHYKRSLAVETGTCLPSTCDSNSFYLYGDKIKQLLNIHVNTYYSEYYISDLYCLPDEESPLRNPLNYTTSTWFIIFNVIWLTLIIMATFIFKFDSKKREGWSSFLSPWSLSKNFNEFISPKRATFIDSDTNKRLKKHQVNLDSIEGFKVMSALSVITSHCIIVILCAASNPSEGQNLISKSWIALSNVVCPSIVDNFFVATGILTSLTLLQMDRKLLTSLSFWIKFIIYRYIRIIPLYLFVHWWAQSYARFLGSGPFWDYGTSDSAWSKLCQEESWWNIIIPRANFISPAGHCLGVGWYLANDIFFALFTPIIILIYITKPMLGHLVTVGASLSIMLNHIYYYYYNGTDPRSIFDWSVMSISRVLDDTTAGYVNPQYRSIAYLLGLAGGHVLNEYRKGVIGWPKPVATHGKKFLFIMMYLICFSPFITTLVPLDNEQLTRILAALFEGSLHTFTSVTSVIFTLYLCTGYLPTLESLYNKPLFKRLASSGLSTMLIHIPLIFYRVQTYQELPLLTFYHVVIYTSVWCVESFIASTVLYLLYELPMRKFLLKLIFGIFDKMGSGAKPDSRTQKSKEN